MWGKSKRVLELEARVDNQQGKIEELKELNAMLLLKNRTEATPMNGTIRFYFSDVNGNLESQIRLALPPYLAKGYDGNLPEHLKEQQAYFWCHKVSVNTYGGEGEMWAEIMDKISSQFKEWSKLIQKRKVENG